ncbi:MAG: hypothetical protein AB1451_16170 [Nitrospirota bacterium]
MAGDVESANSIGTPLEPSFLSADGTAYAGLRTPVRLSAVNATEIGSAVWSSAATAYRVATREVNAGGASNHPLNLKLIDGSGGTAYVLEGYRVVPAELPGDTDLSLVSGRLYHPTHGYVDLSTMVPLHIEDPDGWPSSGAIVASSEDREVLILSAFSDAVYQVVLEQAQQ